ncbi:hypothetical protein E3N88_14665 [Mikania micrantha]|uniref:Uncharacterized protein n=1 Tax=Mikania micrantha TaxID=192012 RepID=A0A5N6P550_9ASTR|nr:hypothetical protein E3N88_14665 [Mikania micrantha]
MEPKKMAEANLELLIIAGSRLLPEELQKEEADSEDVHGYGKRTDGGRVAGECLASLVTTLVTSSTNATPTLTFRCASLT